MSANKKSYRDKRAAVLARDSEKLRREITELEDALILHSRFQAEDDTSLRGIIRREVGGSRWEHGGDGKMRTYRCNADLPEHFGNDKQKHSKGKTRSHRKEMGSQKTSTTKTSSSKSTLSKAHKHLSSPSKFGSVSSHNERGEDDMDEEPFMDITCLNGEWALNTETHAPKKHAQASNEEGNLSEIGALKSRIVAKASAKVIDRRGFKSDSKSKMKLPADDSFNNEMNKSMKIGKRNTLDNNYGRNTKDNDISYSLSFLESLDDSEANPSTANLSKLKTPEVKQKEFSRLHNELHKGNAKNHDIHSKNNSHQSWDVDGKMHHVSKCINTNMNDEFNNSGRWATEREKQIEDSEHYLSRSQRRNSIGGNYQEISETNSKVASNRQSHPVCESVIHSGDKDKTLKDHHSDFPDLFGHVHKSMANAYSIQNNNIEDQVLSSRGNESSKFRLDQEFNSTQEFKSNADDVSSTTDTKPQHNRQLTSSSTIPKDPCDQQVQSWLENLGLQSVEDYIKLFGEHQMDMNSVRLLSASGLRELGIHALGPIMKIIKGVQVLNREAVSKEYFHEKDVLYDVEENESAVVMSQSVIDKQGDKNSKELKTFYHSEDELKDTSSEIVLSENFGISSLENNVVSSKNENLSEISSNTTSSWKRTSDKAEFTNLNDITPKEESDVLQTVDLKEKSTKSGREKKKATTARGGQRNSTSCAKTEEKSQEGQLTAKEGRPTAKVVKKPPVVNNGIVSAHQKLKERKKQEEFHVQSEQMTSARHRQLRDKMAARHTSRRSCSHERATPNTDQTTSLDRFLSSTDSQNLHGQPKSSVTEDIQGLLETKALDVNEAHLTRKKVIAGRDARGEKYDVDILQMKLHDLAAEKIEGHESSDGHKTLNLDVVRELQKQLSHIEQHLVDKLEKMTPTGAEKTSDKSEEEDGNTRLSARERRRQRTPKQSAKSVEGTTDLNTHSFLKVGGILSPQKSKESKSILKDKEGLKTSSDIEDSTSFNPFSDSKEKETEQKLAENVKEEPATIETSQSTYKVNRTLYNSPRRTQDDLRVNKAVWVTEMSRGKVAVAQEYLRKIEIDKKDVSFEKKDLLGDGAFSQVYQGIYQGSEVAIKQLKSSLTPVDKNYFTAEVSLLQELRHPHVVMLLGVCTANPCPFLVLEYMQGGNLFKRLHDFNLPPLSKSDFFQISRDIASGIFYLHNHRPPVLHLDLKSKNVLLGFGNRAKVADFGFSKLKHESDMRMSRGSKSRLSHGSPAWMAPELLAAGEITPKADVYSFTIVLWEMLTREQPYFGLSTFQILEFVRTGQRPPIPLGCPQKLKHLMERNWDQNPCIRPTFKEILQDLDPLSKCKDWRMNCEQTGDDLERKEIERTYKSDTASGFSISANNAVGSSEGHSSVIDGLSNMTNREQNVSQEDETENDDMREEIEEVSESNMAKMTQIKHRTEMNEGKRVAEELFENILEEIKDNSVEDDTDVDKIMKKSLQDEDREELVQKAVSHSVKELSGTVSPIVKSTSFPDEAERPRKENTGSMTQTQTSLEIQNLNETKMSHLHEKVTTPRSVKTIEHASESASTTEMLLNSGRDQNRLDELMKQYLPSPRENQLRKHSSAFNDDAARKLLPLRQSLDRPKKPPKPKVSGKLPVSKSENFGRYGDKSWISGEEGQEGIAKASFTSKMEHDLPNQMYGNNTEMSRNLRMVHERSMEQRNFRDEGRHSQTLRLEKVRPNEAVEESKHDSIVSDVKDIPSNSENKSSPLSYSKDFSEHMEGTKNTPSVSLTDHYVIVPQPDEVLYVAPAEVSFNASELELQKTENNNGVSLLADKVPSLDLSSTELKSPVQTDFGFDCDSSISTDMSVDSLCESLSDDAESSALYKGSVARCSDKDTSVSAQHKLAGDSTFPSQRQKRTDNSRLHGNVRESFFLFNNLHLDLDKLNQGDNNNRRSMQIDSMKKSYDVIPRDKNSKESKSNALSKSLKPKEGLFPVQNGQKSKELFKTTGGAEGTGKLINQHLLKQKSHIGLSPALKESISHAQSEIPPPPSFKSYPPKTAKDRLHPFKSGFPSKSLSSKPEVQGHSRFSVEPGLLLQQRHKLKSAFPGHLSPVKEKSHGKSMPSVASILKKAMDERRVAIGDNQESQDGGTPDASWSIQD